MKNCLKRKTCIMLASVMTLGMTIPALAAEVTAVPNSSPVAINGKAIAIGAYNIDGYNYFKLRDVAAALNGTEANFEVGFDAKTKSIALKNKTAYTSTGNELKDTDPKGNKAAAVSNQKIMLDEKEVSMKSYLIDGYNYFQLRDLGSNLGFTVEWDAAAKTINIVTATTDEKTPAVENEQKTDVQKLQAMIDEAKPYEDITLTGTFTGQAGDKIAIAKPVVIHGKNAVMKNITFEFDAEQVWIEGVTFDGGRTTENAIVVKNGGADSAITKCTFKDFAGDAIVIDQIADKATFTIAENTFTDFGLSETKMDAAITLNATKKSNANYRIWNNTLTLAKDMDAMPEDKMDVIFQTTTVANAPEVYSDTHVEYVNNNIRKGNFTSNTDMSVDIPSNNFTYEFSGN